MNVTVRLPDGVPHPAQIDALVTRCPEFVIHPTLQYYRYAVMPHCEQLDDLWTITHLPTGFAIYCYFPGPEVAMRIANILAYVPMDWPTVTRENAVKRLMALDPRIRDWFTSWDGFRLEWRAKKGAAA